MADEDTTGEGADIPELDEIRKDVDSGKTPKASVRELLRWFGSSRRRSGVVDRIEAELERVGLRTDPHFTTTWIDAPVTFRKFEDAVAAAEVPPSATGDPSNPSESEGGSITAADMTHLVRMLEAANREVISVNPQDSIKTAVTLLLAYDFSQLAVMTGERELKGAISWKSIGSRLSQQKSLKHVSDATEQASEVFDTDSLFVATKTIVEREYVFVRSYADKRITGIVTATDLSEQFQALSEPFLLLGRIEHQIRRLLGEVFDVQTLRDACDENDPKRKRDLTKASQLTFGEYQRIFEKDENWSKLGFSACRKVFCKELDEVRKLRNEIMHFHPDAIEDGDLEPLHRLSRLLEQLDKLAR
jgi:predicted transcriptional regulator